MDRNKIERAKEMFAYQQKYPTTVDKESHREFLGMLDGKEYWTAYNEFYGTDHPLPVETNRNAGS